jgi:hypothetical protein
MAEKATSTRLALAVPEVVVAVPLVHTATASTGRMLL